MYTYKLLSTILAVWLASAVIPSCSCDHPEIVHLDFADRVNLAGPAMGEKAAGFAKVDSSIRNCDIFFLVNESNAKCYGEPVIERFIDTSRFIREAIAQRYNELWVHFYHRGDNTDDLLKTRSTKLLALCNNDIVSEFLWRHGQPRDTLLYDHGHVIGEDDIKLEDMRFKKKP